MFIKLKIRQATDNEIFLKIQQSLSGNVKPYEVTLDDDEIYWGKAKDKKIRF
jgi:hypothetical protein